jgi:hypothetical protein
MYVKKLITEQFPGSENRITAIAAEAKKPLDDSNRPALCRNRVVVISIDVEKTAFFTFICSSKGNDSTNHHLKEINPSKTIFS